MTIPFVKPETRTDLSAVAFHALLAVLEAVQPTGPNVHNVALQLRDALGELSGKTTDKPENLAWVWAQRTLTYAVAEMLAHARRKAPLSGNKDTAIREFLEESTNFGSAVFDQTCFNNPSVSQAFDAAKKAMPKLILAATTGSVLELDQLNTRFAAALRTGSNRVICQDPKFFEPLENALISIGGEGSRRDAAWARHNHWISTQFIDAPVFSIVESDETPLSAVYLRLRCFWNNEFEVNDSNSNFTSTFRNATVADLHDTINSWLELDAKNDPIRVITGGPGSGKSSFAKALAHEVAQKGKHRVAFVRLQHTKLTGSLPEDIGRYFTQFDNRVSKQGNPGLPANPLDWRKEDDTPLLIIFDGLDELTTNEDDGKRYAREFLTALRFMLMPLNNDGSAVRAIVLGRNVACELALRAADLPLGTMLNVAPIAEMSRETCRLSEAFDLDAYKGEDDTGETAESEPYLFDPNSLMKIDQRVEYWQKWARVKGLNPDEVPEPITSPSMSELNVEPLLLHLLINSRYCVQDWEIAAHNKNYVYDDILEKIYDRNTQKDHFKSAKLTKADFFDLMECLGLAAWRGNGRTGDEVDFRKVRKLHLNKEKRFKELHSGELQSVALNIHTRPGARRNDEGFEFIHKSVGEYLAARGLLSHALKTAHQLESVEPVDVEQHWVELFGLGELSSEIVSFLYDEAERTVTDDTAKPAIVALSEFVNWTFEHGAPAHRVFSNCTWRECETRQRRAESNLVAVASAVATACTASQFEEDAPPNWMVNVKWPDSPHGTLSILERLGVTTEGPVITALRRLNLRECHLWSVNLNRADLSESDLRDCNLIRSKAINGVFRHANLTNAAVALCDWIDADLSYAILRGTDFSESQMPGSDFSRADLTRSEVHPRFIYPEPGARPTTFKDSNLRSSVFKEADLKEVNFCNAFLYGVDFSGADMKNVELSNAVIKDADFSSAQNLSLDAINSAFGNEKTKLPDYIEPSEVVWLNSPS